MINVPGIGDDMVKKMLFRLFAWDRILQLIHAFSIKLFLPTCTLVLLFPQ